MQGFPVRNIAQQGQRLTWSSGGLSLPVVLLAKTSVMTTHYLFDMGTRPLAEYDTVWEYLLPDGLGSVRQ